MKRQGQIFRKVCVLLPFYLFTFSTLSAQTFTQQLQKTARGEGTVTLHQDKAIDNLVNGPQPAAASQPKKQATDDKAATANNKSKPREEKKEEHKRPDEKPDSTRPEPQQSDTIAVSGDQRRTGRSYRATGYRVQAFAGGNSRRDRQRAEQTGNQLRALFPSEQVYTHFYSPRWICRIGNYRTYEEAHKMLQEVKRLGYNSATIVKGKISVAY